MVDPSKTTPVNELQDAFAHSESNRAAAVQAALEHGATHLKEREAQRAAKPAGKGTGANPNATRG